MSISLNFVLGGGHQVHIRRGVCDTGAFAALCVRAARHARRGYPGQILAGEGNLPEGGILVERIKNRDRRITPFPLGKVEQGLPRGGKVGPVVAIDQFFPAPGVKLELQQFFMRGGYRRSLAGMKDGCDERVQLPGRNIQPFGRLRDVMPPRFRAGQSFLEFATGGLRIIQRRDLPNMRVDVHVRESGAVAVVDKSGDRRTGHAETRTQPYDFSHSLFSFRC